MTPYKFSSSRKAVLLGIWSWLTPRRNLSRTEIDRYLVEVAKLPATAEEMAELLARLRAWAEADDGKPFYMLNLMRYYDRLHALPGGPDFAGTPQESNALYEKCAQRMLLKVGGYPLLMGPVQGKNLMTYEADLDNWSRVLVVRYPSRRAFLRLMTNPAYAAIEPYKVMALKVALVPVSGEVVLPDLSAAVGAALLCLFLAVGWIRAAQTKPQPQGGRT